MSDVEPHQWFQSRALAIQTGQPPYLVLSRFAALCFFKDANELVLPLDSIRMCFLERSQAPSFSPPQSEYLVAELTGSP